MAISQLAIRNNESFANTSFYPKHLPNLFCFISAIMKDVYPRKQSIVSKYALPVMWKLLESSSSASTGSGNMKEAVHGLANLLYSLMGQSLFEQAQAKSHRLRQKLKELLDQRLDQ
jgi:hypothetical protein